jgi:hypothetical protein
VALILGLGALGLSIFTIIYSFEGQREYDLKLYGQDIIQWQEVEFVNFQNVSVWFNEVQLNELYSENQDRLVSNVD